MWGMGRFRDAMLPDKLLPKLIPCKFRVPTPKPFMEPANP